MLYYIVLSCFVLIMLFPLFLFGLLLFSLLCFISILSYVVLTHFHFCYVLIRHLILFSILYFFSSTIFTHTHYILGGLSHFLIAKDMPGVERAMASICKYIKYDMI